MRKNMDDECYVAFIDILGFKSLMREKTPGEVLDIFKVIVNSKKEIMSEVKSTLRSEFEKNKNSMAIKVMSDSIVLAIPISYNISLAYLCYCCTRIQAELFQEGIVVRGGIGKGHFYLRDDIMFGKGLVNAYQMQEIAECPRLIISPDVIKEYDDRVGTSGVIYVTDFICFTEDNLYMTHFLRQFTNDQLELAKKFIEGNIMDGSIAMRIRKKYLWLAKYYNDYLQKEMTEDEKYGKNKIEIDITRGR